MKTIMKNIGLIAVVLLFLLTIQPCQAGGTFSFFDDFNDGNADGWWLGYSHHTTWLTGNWQVANGTLTEMDSGDTYVALVENLALSDQVIETQVWLDYAGGGGITLWYHDFNNWIMVLLYPDAGFVRVCENINGSFYVNSPDSYIYPYTASHYTWYDLKVDANSVKGRLAVYIDGTYLFTHKTNTPYRSGLSGINCNGGNFFDNFKLTYKKKSKN